MSAKNCPESTRQKMINMMYLVLTAMLALNVASEVLESFRIIDASLTQTLNTVNRKNEQIYDSFAAAYQKNPAKVQEWKEKADQVRSNTRALVTKITDLKEQLALASGGIAKKEAGLGFVLPNDEPIIINAKGDTVLVKNQDDLNTPSEIMIKQKKADDLKSSINQYRVFLASFLSETDPLRENLSKQLDTSDPKIDLTEGGEKKTWETRYFESKPLIAIITLLSKMQIDVQNAESNILSILYSNIDATSFKFNKLEARILPKSNYVLKGDQFETEIYLAAIDTTQKPEVFVGGSKITPNREGKFIYTSTASEPGTKTYAGYINFKNPEGNVIPYSFKGEYQVGLPNVTISPTKMNVFYLGVPNPIKVSVPGIAAENIEISVSNGTYKKSADGYLVYPTKLDATGKSTSVSVIAIVNGEKRPMGSEKFRVKAVPPPLATVGDKNGGVLKKEDLLAEEGIFADLKDFDFDLKFKVTQFDITFSGATGFVTVYKGNGNRFTPEQKEQFKKLTQGSAFIIDNITAKGDDGASYPLSPISFKIR
ncbi:MAG TPA: gliding motility protein GldM [Prolixibacteraceae bacterium]|jgi:gliding motility-associated protein GldM